LIQSELFTGLVAILKLESRGISFFNYTFVIQAGNWVHVEENEMVG